MRSIYSFIITQSGGQSRRFNASSLVVKGLIALCGIVFFGFLTSVALNVKLGIHYSNTKQIVQDQEEQVKVIKTLTDEVQSLRQLVDDLIQKEEEIRQDLGSQSIENYPIVVESDQNDVSSIEIIQKIINPYLLLINYLEKLNS